MAFNALCQPEHIDCAMDAGLRRLNRIALIMNWRGRACQIVDLVDLDIERKRHVMTDQFKMFVVEQVLDILPIAGEEIVDA